jgi:hypothetical protein
VSLGFIATESVALELPPSCQRVLDRYVSGVTPKTLTPLSRNSALYLLRNRDGTCGWGTGNDKATLAAAKQLALATCKSYATNEALPCMLAGVNGRAVSKGVVAGPPSPATSPRPALTRMAARGKSAIPTGVREHCLRQVGAGIDPVTKRWMFFSTDRDAMSRVEMFRMCLAGGDRAKANTIAVPGFSMSHPGDRGPMAR